MGVDEEINNPLVSRVRNIFLPIPDRVMEDEVAVMAPPKKEVPEVYRLPWIERVVAGEVVPMPTRPPAVASHAPWDTVRLVLEA
ncbi:MAG: hypothetical protein AABZ49_03585 [Thermoproteota archaeon]